MLYFIIHLFHVYIIDFMRWDMTISNYYTVIFLSRQRIIIEKIKIEIEIKPLDL